MKLGCCISMFSTPEDPLGCRMIPVLKEAGYDYAELPLAPIAAMREEAFSKLLEDLQAAGLPCTYCNCFLPGSIRLTGNDADFAAAEGYFDTALARAQALGVKTVVFGSSGARSYPDGFSKETAFHQLVEVLRLAEPYAAKYGITIAIEPLNTRESNILNTVEEGFALAQAVDCPHIQLLVDYYHFAYENVPVETLAPFMSRICHIHFAEPVGRIVPVEKKEEYRKFFDVVKSSGYNGGISLEAATNDPVKDLAAATLLREYF